MASHASLDVTAPMGIDVLVRFHDPKGAGELDRALFSLVNQTFAPVHPIVVTQNFDEGGRRALESQLGRYPWAPEHVAPTVVDVACEPGRDIRSRLLNVGIARARHRFLAVLDFDDYLYQHAYEHLVGEALRHHAALAFGGIVVKHVRVFPGHVYNLRRMEKHFRGETLEDLLLSNFCPIHSFVLDRSRVDPKAIHFDEGLTRLEDYDFLLRLCSAYPAHFGSRTRDIGVYNWRVDGSNSVQVFEADEAKRRHNAAEWTRARLHVERLQASLRAQVRPRSGSPSGQP